jgi:redox-sensitive bicupin YhaK (pirin superfamily)
MSAMGQKRTFAAHKLWNAMPSQQRATTVSYQHVSVSEQTQVCLAIYC